LRLPINARNKAELVADVSAEIQAFRELTGVRYPLLAVSAATGLGLGEIAPWLFGHLGIVRVYTKTPGHLPEKDRSFTLRRGQTIRDVARLVHQDLARSLRYARVWGRPDSTGNRSDDHAVEDGDVVELHT
jgi:ribosome-interacting GTPase 1